jgi:hypothetical protein
MRKIDKLEHRDSGDGAYSIETTRIAEPEEQRDTEHDSCRDEQRRNVSSSQLLCPEQRSTVAEGATLIWLLDSRLLTGRDDRGLEVGHRRNKPVPFSMNRLEVPRFAGAVAERPPEL